MIFTTEQSDQAQIERLRERGAEVIIMGEHRVDLAGALISQGYRRAQTDG